MNHKTDTHLIRQSDVGTLLSVCAGLCQSFTGHLDQNDQNGSCLNSVVTSGPRTARVIHTLSISNTCKESFPELQTAFSPVTPTCSFC